MSYFNGSDKIECPFCKHEFDTDDFYPEQDSITEVECGGCEKTYTITTNYTPSYETMCGDEDTRECKYKLKLINGEKKYYQSNPTSEMLVYGECVNCEETNYVKEEDITEKENE